MLDEAISTLAPGERPVVHSDRGCHYRWPGWLQRLEAADLTRSMSRKGCTPDNAACEAFFGRLKIEFFYARQWTGTMMEQFIAELDAYIRWVQPNTHQDVTGRQEPRRVSAGSRHCRVKTVQEKRRTLKGPLRIRCLHHSVSLPYVAYFLLSSMSFQRRPKVS